MLKVLASLGLIASLGLMPLAAIAETPTTAPGAHPTTQHHAHKPTRSYRSEMRRRGNQSRERARASAEHMRTMHNQ